MRSERLAAAGLLATLLLAGPGARADTLIGVVGQMTGPSASSGEQLQRGAEAAVEDLNARGGVLGQKVRLSTLDDACEARQAVAAAEKLVSQGIVFVAGHNCSGASIPASEVYQKAGVLQISPASTNPRLTELGRINVFRICGRDDQQGEIAATLIARRFWGSKIAILHDGSTYGSGLADETRSRLRGRGVTEVLFDAIVPNQADYSEAIGRIQAAGAVVLYYGGYPAEAALLMRSAREAGLSVQLISGDAIATNLFLQVAGAAGIGTMFTFYPDARRLPQAAEAVARFRTDGYEPEGNTLHAYAAVQVWAQAAVQAGSLDIDKVLTAMHDLVFVTIVGDISFDAKGDLRQPAFEWYVWQEKGYEPVP